MNKSTNTISSVIYDLMFFLPHATLGYDQKQ